MDNNTNTQKKDLQSVQVNLELRDWVILVIQRWYWFLLSTCVCCGVALVWILQMPSTYTRKSSVMIKQETGSRGGFSTVTQMDMFRLNSSVDNELIAMQSPAVMLEVAKRLNLQYNYSTDARFHRQVLYGSNLPVHVLVDNGDYPTSFTVLLNGRNVRIMDLAGDTVAGGATYAGVLGRPINTPVGHILVTPTGVENGVTTVYVSKSTLQSAMSTCQGHFSAAQHDKTSDIIDLTYTDYTPERAEDVLNMVVTVYSEFWVRDKNLMAISTSKFIADRLSVIEKELGDVDSDISNYKSSNLILGDASNASQYLGRANGMEDQALELETQLYMTRYVQDYLKKAKIGKDILPTNLGMSGGDIESQLSTYNNMLLQRNTLVANSSASNALVLDMEDQMRQQYNVIKTSLNNYEATLEAQIARMGITEDAMKSKAAIGPDQEKHLINIERQQKVKESLYIFLLQKLEENELSQAFTAYNTRIITPPMGSPAPTGPDRRKYLLIAFALGMALPIAAIYIVEVTNTKVRGRRDLEMLTIPFVGEIPLYLGHHHTNYKHLFRNWWRQIRGKKTKRHDEQKVVVKPQSRNIINEAFRVIRANLEFMSKGQKVFLFTSSNPGSGKTFLTFNLSYSYALKGQKVMAVDLDMRRCSLSKFVGNPSSGISNYLAGQEEDWHSMAVMDDRYPGLTVMPSGTVPPNPTELLYTPYLKKFLEEARKEYDVIFIDCPPAEIVADASIVGKLVDRTIFVVRAALFEREFLDTLQGYYDENAFPNLAVLLNGTELAYKGYGYGRYGYGRYAYGYHYGYGYSYGYGYYHKNSYTYADDE